MATALRLYFGKVPCFRFCLPGSEIPDWFTHQKLGSSITLGLSQQYCCNRRLIGFALSVVVTFEESNHRPGIVVYYKYSYADGGDIIGEVDYFSDSIESDHIGICFSPCMDVRLLEAQCTSITFQFFQRQAGRSKAIESRKLKCCGVCPMYEEPGMGLSTTSLGRFASTHEDINETMSVDCSNTSGSGDGGSSDEEVEPHPKRIRRNQINSS